MSWSNLDEYKKMRRDLQYRLLWAVHIELMVRVWKEMMINGVVTVPEWWAKWFLRRKA